MVKNISLVDYYIGTPFQYKNLSFVKNLDKAERLNMIDHMAIKDFHKRHSYVDPFVNLIIGAILGGAVSDIYSKFASGHNIFTLHSFWVFLFLCLVALLYLKFLGASAASKYEYDNRIREALTEKAVEVIGKIDSEDPAKLLDVSDHMFEFIEKLR